MPRSITILIPKKVDINKVEQFSTTHNYYVYESNSCLVIEKEYNPINESRSYIMAKIATDYLDLAIEQYLEFDNVDEHKVSIIKNCAFLNMMYNDSIFLYSYLKAFLEYFHNFSDQILIDDDYGDLFTIEEFKAKYLSHSA